MKNIISIRIDKEDLDKISALSETENVSRSVIVQKALKKYLKEYGKIQPPTEELLVRLERLEKNFSGLLTRVNILTTQIDSLRQRSSQDFETFKRK